MKRDTKRTVLVGFAFLSICAFWQMYDNLVPKVLTESFGVGWSKHGDNKGGEATKDLEALGAAAPVHLFYFSKKGLGNYAGIYHFHSRPVGPGHLLPQ